MTTDQALLEQLLMEKYEPIAVVGAGFRFPGGHDTLDGFGEFLDSGGSGCGPIPPDRWDVAAHAATGPDQRGRIRTAGGGFLDDLTGFDPRFFNMSPREAQFVDPQQRLVLECAWAALEDAGIDPFALRGGDGGVFLGVSCVDYVLELSALSNEQLEGHIGAGTAHSAVCGRLSHLLGLTGPSVSVDTACSSSLVALHLAVEALRRGECGIALCGGVSRIHHPWTHIVLSDAGMLSPDGLCKTFDETADGYGRSEGGGVVVLKRLSDARRDHDRVLGLVRGTAVRQDGASGGLTVPNGVSQAAVMRDALRRARLRPAQIGYVEAHGTGTPLGDAVEVESIAAVFGGRAEPVPIASVKTNLGHTEAAAGMAGLLKSLLQMRSGRIFPHLNVRRLTGKVPWDRLPVEVPLRGRDWAATDGPRRALVNSFGFAGTVASAVIEEPPAIAEPARPGPDAAEHVLTVSAKSPRALDLQLRAYRELLAARPEVDLAVFCRTTNVGRAHHEVRHASVVGSPDELRAAVQAPAEALPDVTSPSGTTRIAFLFTGQGAQRVGMAATLYASHPGFRTRLDECLDLIRARGIELGPVLLGTGGTAEELTRTKLAQPALFAVEYALAGLWRDLGAEPTVLAGHSVGEIAAAVTAGVLRLADAVTLVTERARLMQAAEPGGMLSLPVDRATLDELLAAHPLVGVAAVNGPANRVVSGPGPALDALAEDAAARGLHGKRLQVSHAFHSPMMADAAARLLEVVRGLELRRPTIPIVPGVAGAVSDDLATPEYWSRQIVEPVQFLDAVRAIDRIGPHLLLEMGPAAVLTALVEAAVDPGRHVLAGGPARTGAPLHRPVAEAYRAGVTIDWSRFHGGGPLRRVEVPFTVFDKRPCWAPVPARTESEHPLLGSATADGLEFTASVDTASPAFLADHTVEDRTVFPAAGFLEMVLAAQEHVLGEAIRPIEDIEIHEALFLADDAKTELITRLSAVDGGYRFEIASRSAAGPERRHMSGRIGASAADAPEIRPGDGETRVVSAADFYDALAAAGLGYGPAFRRVTGLRRTGAVTEADVRGEPAPGVMCLPPPLLDGALHSILDGVPYLPIRIERVRLRRKPRGAELRAVSRMRRLDEETGTLTADLVVSDRHGVVCEVVGLTGRRVARSGAPLSSLRWVPGATAERRRRVRDVVVAGLPCGAVAELRDAAATHDVRVWAAEDGAEAAALAREYDADICWFWRAGGEPIRAECERNYTDLLGMLHDLDRIGFTAPQRLWLVTRGAVAADPAGGAPAAATLWGFGRTIRQEHPRFGATLVDLAVDAGFRPLAAEWTADDPGEAQIALDTTGRSVRRLATVAPGDSFLPPLDPAMTYVVVGGFGGLGQAVARFLADRGARHLVLTGRRVPAVVEPFGPPVRVTALAADVGTAEGVATLVDGLAGMRVGGLVHAAGVLDDVALTGLTWQRLDAVLAAKVYGARLLAEALDRMPGRPFLLAFSSISALLGPPTQAAYAAANAYLDVLARNRTAAGAPSLSVNWGPWREVGMAARLGDDHARDLARRGVHSLTPDEALAALAAVPAGTPQVVVGRVDWSQALLNPDACFAPVERTRERAYDIEALRRLTGAEREAAITDVVRAEVARHLRIGDLAELGPQTSLLDLGLDSLAAIRLKNSLEEVLGVPLATEPLLKGASARQIAAIVAATWAGPAAEPDGDEAVRAELALLKDL